MYDDDAPFVLSGGRLSTDAAREIIEVGREALRVKEPVAPEKIFDFSLAQEAGRGRQGREWRSLRGNFFGSTLVDLQPQDPPAPTLS